MRADSLCYAPPASPGGRLVNRLVLLASSLALSVGCAAKVDGFTVNRAVPRALVGGDLEMACAMGESTSYALVAVPSADNPPNRAAIIGYATGAMCAELTSMEHELAAARAEHLWEGAAQIAAIKDARTSAERAHGLAAERFYRAFQATEAHYGPTGEGCPKFSRQRDELSYLVGLVSGMNAVLHDKTAGGPVGVPLDVLPRVARSTECLDDETWWQVPAALRAGAWATVPGSGPADVDPWALLDGAAAAGEGQGVRVARALQVLLNANAGRADEAREGMKKHGESLTSTAAAEEWRLLDEYARRVSLHQSDLVWTATEGYRTPSLGDLPRDESETLDDPFGADPFGADPFGAAPAPDEPPSDATPDAPSGEETE